MRISSVKFFLKYINRIFRSVQPVNYKEFEKGLERLGVDVTMATVRNWARRGLIPKYTPHQRKKKLKKLDSDSITSFGFFDSPYKIKPISCYRGDTDSSFDGKARRKRKRRPGRFTDWSEDALVEAAAVWAVKYCNRDCKGNVIPWKAVTPATIGTVQLIAREVYSSPHPFYKIAERMIDCRWEDPPSFNPFTYKDVEMKLVRDEKRNRLTVTYIAAVEKARRGTPVTEPRRVILKQDILKRTRVSLRKSESRAILEKMLAQSAQEKGRKLTPDEVRRAERVHEKAANRISPVVCTSPMHIDLEPTNAECDEIELWVRQPGSDEWVDSRKLVMRATVGSNLI